ncbi:hypothetical protein [Erwinia sp. S38]|uniref:hypothetical protein n=1 Tax=Erwinia sp. S38 TaxID=2769338 RepID=UPI00190D656D|nr:hypothetical protein [Erwinia sp. S38]MBK0004241.1 hypothetical protein [Erwinia sp. S38]
MTDKAPGLNIHGGLPKTAETARRTSPLQKRILIVLAALSQKRPGPVAISDLKNMLERGSVQPVYANNLRGSCKRMNAAGWLRILRAPNLQLAVELTDSGADVALPLLNSELEAVQAQLRAAGVRVLHERSESSYRPVHNIMLDGREYAVWRGDFVVRLDGTTCLQLWHRDGRRTVFNGDPVQVAEWYQTCFEAGLPVRCQVNQGLEPQDEKSQ